MTKTQLAVLQWLANMPNTDAASRTMAFYLGFGTLPKVYGRTHPQGQGAFSECLELLDAAPGLRKKLPEMASLSREWKRLVAGWQQLEETLVAEEDLTRWRRPEKGTTRVMLKAFIAGTRRPRRLHKA